MRKPAATDPWEAPYPGAVGSLALAAEPAPAPAPTDPPPQTRPKADGTGVDRPLVHTVEAADFELFRAIVARVRAQKPAVAALFENAVVLEVSKDKLRVAYEHNSFLAAQASDAETLELFTREVRAHFDAPTVVELDVSSKSLAGKATLAAVAAEKERARVAAARAATLAHPLVQEVIRLFDAEVRELRLPQDDRAAKD